MNAVQALRNKLAEDPTAESQAKELVDALHKIAEPLATSEAKAKEFEDKVKALQEKAEERQTTVQTDAE